MLLNTTEFYQKKKIIFVSTPFHMWFNEKKKKKLKSLQCEEQTFPQQTAASLASVCKFILSLFPFSHSPQIIPSHLREEKTQNT